MNYGMRKITVATEQSVRAFNTDYIMALSDEEIDRQLAFLTRLEAACKEHGKPMNNPSLVYQGEQLRAERMRRDGVAP